jgi:hypothetical protein
VLEGQRPGLFPVRGVRRAFPHGRYEHQGRPQRSPEIRDGGVSALAEIEADSDPNQAEGGVEERGPAALPPGRADLPGLRVLRLSKNPSAAPAGPERWLRSTRGRPAPTGGRPAPIWRPSDPFCRPPVPIRPPAALAWLRSAPFWRPALPGWDRSPVRGGPSAPWGEPSVPRGESPAPRGEPPARWGELLALWGDSFALWGGRQILLLHQSGLSIPLDAALGTYYTLSSSLRQAPLPKPKRGPARVPCSLTNEVPEAREGAPGAGRAADMADSAVLPVPLGLCCLYIPSASRSARALGRPARRMRSCARSTG